MDFLQIIFTICVVFTIVDKDLRTAKALNTTSSPLSIVNESTIQILDVSDDSFVVKFDAITGAANYVVRYYLGDVTNDTVSNSTSVTITDVSPLENEYLVAIAYMIPTQSAFTNNVSTMIWNFNATLIDSITLSWRTFLSPSTTFFYLYSVLNPDNSQHAVRNVGVPSLTVENLLPATTYTFVVSASVLSGGAFTDTALFSIKQITRTSPPTGFSFLASSDSVSIRWDNVEGAESYESTVYEPTTGSVVANVVGVGTHGVNNAILINLTNGQFYTFEVCAVNSAGSSCGNISINGPLPTPNPPTAESVTQTSINLTYDNVEGATMYNILVEDPSGNVVTNFTESENHALISGLAPGITYDVSLSVIYPAGSSPNALLSQITAPPNVAGINVTSRSSTSLSIEYLQSLGSDRYLIGITETSPFGAARGFTSFGLTALVTGLADGISYSITVSATNSAGSSQPSIITDEFTRSISPPELFFSNTTTSSFNVRWDAQRPNLPTTNYILRVVLSSSGASPAGLSIGFISDTEAKVSGLDAGTVHTVTIQTEDAFGISALATRINHVTLPAITTGLVITDQTSNSLTVVWNLIQSANAYRVTVNNTALSSLVIDKNVTTLSFTATSLVGGQEYEISVFAYNENGFGQASTVKDFTISDPFPSTAQLASNTETSITVNITEVSGVVNYTVRAMLVGAADNITCIAVNKSGCTNTGLLSGRDYLVSVRGIYRSGDQSKFGNETEITAVPSRPTNLNTSSGDFSLNISTETVIGASFYTFAIPSVETVSSANQFATFTGLSSGTIYNITSAATKTTSYGNFTSSTTTLTAKTTQAILSNVLVSDVQPNQFNVSWDAIQGAVGYLVNVVPLDTLTRVVTVASGISLTAVGLKPGIVHNITVQGTYETGNGSESEVVQQITGPTTTMGLTVQAVTANNITVSWNQVDTATSYRVTYSDVSSTAAMSVLTTNFTAFIISGLLEATTYRISVVAINNHLESEQSIELRQITAPLAPTFVANSTTQTTIWAVWSNPSGADSYLVEVLNETSDLTIFATVTSNTFITLTEADGKQPGQNYTLCVRAQTHSNSSGGVTASARTCIKLLTAPGNSSSPIEIASTADSLSIVWEPAVGANDYELTLINLNTSSQVFKSRVGSVTDYTFTGLKPSRLYEATVTGFNRLGAMNFNSSASFITNPETPMVTSANITTTSIEIAWSNVTGAVRSIVSVTRADGLPIEAYCVSVQNNENCVDEILKNLAVISRLNPGTEYIFSISSSSFSKTSAAGRLAQITLPGLPAKVEVVDQSPSSIVLTWSSVNGTSQYFATIMDTSSSIFLSSTLNTITFSGLSPGTVYTGFIFASNSAGNGSRSHFSTATVISSGPAITITSISEFSIAISYPAAVGAIGYRISYLPVFGDLPMQMLMTTTYTNATVSPLFSGVRYNIEVAAVYEAGISDESIVVVYTKTEPPSNLQSDASTDGILIRFTAPVGAFNHTITWTGANGDFGMTGLPEQTPLSAFISNIVLGVPYNFSVISHNPDGLASQPAQLINVQAPVVEYTYQARLKATIIFISEYNDPSSMEYITLVNGVTAELRQVLSPINGVGEFILNAIYRGSVVIEFQVNITAPGVLANDVARNIQANIPSNFTFLNATETPSIDLDYCLSNPCPLHSTCSTSMQNFLCTCDSGLFLNQTANKCEDEDECRNNNPCHVDAECTNTFGSFSCACKDGFQGNGNICRNINECAVSILNNCDANAFCTDLSPGFSCSCDSGFTGNGISCVDINECQKTPCHTNASCENSEGSFTCSCFSGFNGDGFACNDIDECISNMSTCSNEALCNNTIGSFSCTCRDGFSGNGTICNDIDECIVGCHNCHDNASCTNSIGSFLCPCKNGFVENNASFCLDVDECLHSNNCHANASCLNMIGSFSCECHHGFSGDGFSCKNIDECLSLPCSDSANCTDTAGSFTCACNSGFSGNGFSCQNINECAETNPCHHNASCTDQSPGFTCTCNNGYSGNGTLCEDINECLNFDVCHANAVCSNNNGSFTCTCDNGYRGDGRNCTDINECLTGNHSCHSYASCNNTEGGYACSCKDGFTGNGIICMDSDECTYGEDNCHGNAICINTVGSFMCSCDDGYEGNGVVCLQVDECSRNISNCHSNASCSDTEGSFTCACKIGYTGNGLHCFNADECDLGTDICNDNATCSDTDGSYYCTCNQGFTGNGIVCEDIDECVLNVDDCDPSATCINSQGGFSCSCNPGYSGSGENCDDVDECRLSVINCHSNATCNNTIGNYTCTCNPGYSGDGLTCTDLNECLAETNYCHGNATCTNTDGSFLCNCKEGFTGSGFACGDINECDENVHECHLNATCSNTRGTYSCDCNKGFTGDGMECVDINECDMLNPCDPNADCNNLVGSYNCVCRGNFAGNGFTCEDTRNPCDSVTCGGNAVCVLTDGETICECDEGFVGNAYELCTERSSNSCEVLSCGENAACFFKDGIAACECNNGFVGNAYESCTEAVCIKSVISEGRVNFTFNRTLPGLIAYSNERCPTGYPQASILCNGGPDASTIPSFALESLAFVGCTNTSIEMVTSNVNFENITTEEVEQILTILNLQTSVVDQITPEDIVNVVETIGLLSDFSDRIQISSMLFENIISIGDHVTQSLIISNNVNFAMMSQEERLLTSLDNLGFQVVLPENQTSLKIMTPSIACEIVDERNTTKTASFEPSVYLQPTSRSQEVPVRIDIPPEALQYVQQENGSLRKKRNVETNTSAVRLVFFAHRTGALFPSGENTSWVGSASLNKEGISNLQEPVKIIHLRVDKAGGRQPNEEPFKLSYVNETCAFWNFSTDAWSTAGCCLVENSNPPECRCNHLTNFAMLLSTYDIPEDVVLSTATTVGCIISIVCLVVTVLLLVIPKHIRRKRPTKILINVCINLMLSYIGFLSGIDKRRNIAACVSSTVLLHFFLLSTWFWMAVYAHVLYKSFVQVLSVTWDRYLTKSFVISYGLPLIIVVINVIVTLTYSHHEEEPPVCGKDENSDLAVSAMLADNMCWLHSHSLHFSFLLPVGLLLVFNVVIFFMVVRKLTWKRNEVSSSIPKRSVMQQLVVAITIAASLGLVWLLGYFLLLSDNVIYFTVMNWLFTVAVSLQGVCIFLLLCVRKGDIRNVWWPPVYNVLCYPFRGYIAKDNKFTSRTTRTTYRRSTGYALETAKPPKA
ncbi:uncharacterized protein LOC143450508 [Clavelina lepadiformis]|uniref:uncharacterized protein LOC143450508 n=1 Tax=Clavelina lepadiformis TaxID=159417 RepID=UPI0040416C21